VEKEDHCIEAKSGRRSLARHTSEMVRDASGDAVRSEKLIARALAQFRSWLHGRRRTLWRLCFLLPGLEERSL